MLSITLMRYDALANPIILNAYSSLLENHMNLPELKAHLEQTLAGSSEYNGWDFVPINANQMTLYRGQDLLLTFTITNR